MKLEAPFTGKKMRALKVGDAVEISGVIHTGRDAFHKHLHDGGALPRGVRLRDGILYHCGPVVLREKGKWRVVAAGPTTSIREEPYQHEVIRKFGLRGVIGKGGMGEKTLDACKDCGCVYLHAVGGAAQVLAECITEVTDVHFLKEFGAPEAMWEFRVVNFPAVVTMDAHGNSLHRNVLRTSRTALEAILGQGIRRMA
ncbi:MAG: fumarate hydratase C-terminal domain-containing protein [Verrucomicrobiae bacterium]|nr:fumarate hydratase C-terminal domain-containing protein [Verrucomicrobiae bacterium]